MSLIIKITTLVFFQIIYISCNAICNKETNQSPTSKYHCSGLKIEPMTNFGDTHCCLWKYINQENKEITRCSSINQYQFNNLDAYIAKKINSNNTIYNQLEIECTKDQKLYCSNIVLDEEDIADCSSLAISFEDDYYCCRWKFKDSENHNKNNNYCASINEFEFYIIKSYVSYKNNHPLQRYNDLSIDCANKFLRLTKVLSLLYLILL